MKDLPRLRLAAKCTKLADRTGDVRFRHAAAILAGSERRGRSAVDDSAALALVDRLMQAGLASKGEACARAAGFYTPPGARWDSTYKRLMRKITKKYSQ